MCTDILFKVNAWLLHLAVSPSIEPLDKDPCRTPSPPQHPDAALCDTPADCVGMVSCPQILGLVSNSHHTPPVSRLPCHRNYRKQAGFFCPIFSHPVLFAPQNKYLFCCLRSSLVAEKPWRCRSYSGSRNSPWQEKMAAGPGVALMGLGWSCHWSR